MKSKYDGIPDKLEADLLVDNCYMKRDEEVRHDFSDAEMEVLKDELYVIAAHETERHRIKDKVVELLQTSAQADDIAQQIRAIEIGNIGDISMKQLKKDFKKQLAKITSGYEIKVMPVYGFDHQDVERMAFYDADGNYIYDRPLTASEHQTKINLSLTA